MNATLSPLGQANHPSRTDELLELELKVARRADELSRTIHVIDKHKWECWFKAESEIFGKDTAGRMMMAGQR